MLESLDFYFGGKSYKVAEAGLMFSYEIGREGRQLYIVALTENFGTIIFYIPESVEERIKKRVQQFPFSLDDYLSFLIEFQDFDPVEAQLMKCKISFRESAAALERLSGRVAQAGTTAQKTAYALRNLITELNKANQNQELVSNNWLKMHGFPMRRKGRGKKKHE